MATGLQKFESNPPIWDDEDDSEEQKQTDDDTKPTRVRSSIPFTSFDNTIQNVSAISFVLGCFFTFNLLMLVCGSGKYSKLNVHLLLLTIFHLLEFMVTAIWNPSRVTIDAFLLNNGASYYYAQIFTIFEFLLTQHFYPPSRSHIIDLIALFVLLLGQFIRTLSMVTAAQSFSHKVSTHKRRRPDHLLVTTGVYQFLRHPSYFGFFWWSIGLQCYLRTYISLVIFSFVLWRFFSHRIQEEELHLIKFFGKAYIDYKSRTRVYIPFIR
ncbi:hypothetical protein CROQUDRAFT_39382 [Cronartium quercuum f. sp. fusiforme G11]|uniref:Protein-S-isoprenylcysteine O-methyltransferase n=1 Tax=Cronartium quercuum f. sp. fusiforme G11 TaxID=708437 RepID=A0A9P6NPE1_9BASI|nr:hypothetical protein CROQUDRAFT_39382 [Cronartium quercuum f. sp. fusiforme G11]